MLTSEYVSGTAWALPTYQADSLGLRPLRGLCFGTAR